MKILVTGAAGFIGSHAAQAFSTAGHEVWGLDNFDPFYDKEKKLRNWSEAGLGSRLTEVDILDKKGLSDLFQQVRPDLVVHLAAKAGVRPSIADPAGYARVNIEGTVNIYEACKSFGTRRVILASSSSVYGARNTVPFREDDDVTKPYSPYAASKVAAELYAANYARLHGISTAALRFFTVYGPRQRPDLAIALFFQRILAGEPIPVFGDGSTQRDYTYVDDILDGLLKAASWVVDQPDGVYDVFNLGENRTVSLAELIGAIGKTAGLAVKEDRRPLQPGDVPVTCADIEKARRVLGYRPQVDLEEGLRKYYGWYTANTKEKT